MTEKTPSFDEMIATLRGWLTNSPDSGRLWDVLTALRGPDSPSEHGGMDETEYQKAYKGRRDRKYKTVEIIRGVSGLKGGSCRHHIEPSVRVPKNSQDHFDRHVVKAASALGIGVIYE